MLFIGLNQRRFTYIRLNAIVCGFFRVARLPVTSTFWRYLNSLGINQANCFLNIMRLSRERVWQQCGLVYAKIHVNIDTTVEIIYGNRQGGRKGDNTRNRGKEAYRAVVSFIDET